MHERRAYIRVPVGVETTYQVLNDLSPPRFGMSEDLSLGGMRITPSERLDPGERVSVHFTLPREGKISLTGVVVWSRVSSNGGDACDAGIRWVEVNPSAQARLNAFLTDRTRSYQVIAPAAGLLPEPFISWPRVVAVAFVVFLFTALAARLWVSQYALNMEVNSLKAANASYKQQIDSLLGLPKFP